MAKCEFCESKEAGNGNIVVDDVDRSIGVQVIYWGNGEVDICGGVIPNDDLMCVKTVKINYCPVCGKKLRE